MNNAAKIIDAANQLVVDYRKTVSGLLGYGYDDPGNELFLNRLEQYIQFDQGTERIHSIRLYAEVQKQRTKIIESLEYMQNNFLRELGHPV